MSKNYYIILGISPGSSQREIKEAYRRLAKEFHPDYYGEDLRPFQVLQEAYSVLSDPQSRRSHDQALNENAAQRQAHPVEPARRRHFAEDIEPLVPEAAPSFTGDSPANRPFRRSRSTFDSLDSLHARIFEDLAESHAPDIDQWEEVRVEISLSPEQARRGGDIRLRVPFKRHCPSCNWAGNSRSIFCRRCHGAGILSGERPVILRYPAGIADNHTFHLVLQPDAAGEIHLTALFRVS